METKKISWTIYPDKRVMVSAWWSQWKNLSFCFFSLTLLVFVIIILIVIFYVSFRLYFGNFFLLVSFNQCFYGFPGNYVYVPNDCNIFLICLRFIMLYIERRDLRSKFTLKPTQDKRPYISVFSSNRNTLVKQNSIF